MEDYFMKCVIINEKDIRGIRQLTAVIMSTVELMYSTSISMNGRDIDVLNMAHDVAEEKLSILTKKYPSITELSNQLIQELEDLCQNNAFLKETLGFGIARPDQLDRISRELNPKSNIGKTLLPLVKAAKDRRCGIVIF